MSFTTTLSRIIDHVQYDSERARNRHEIAKKHCVSHKVLCNGLNFYRLNVDFHEAVNAGEDVLPPVLISGEGVVSVDANAVVRTRSFARNIAAVSRLSALHKQGHEITCYDNPESGAEEYKILPPKPKSAGLKP